MVDHCRRPRRFWILWRPYTARSRAVHTLLFFTSPSYGRTLAEARRQADGGIGWVACESKVRPRRAVEPCAAARALPWSDATPLSTSAPGSWPLFFFKQKTAYEITR